MADNAAPRSWRDELVNLMDDPGVRYVGEGLEIGEMNRMDFRTINDGAEHQRVEESLQEQVKGFLQASAEMLHELAVGCKDILQQTLEDKDSFVVRNFGGPCSVVSSKLKFLNEYLPEDKDPVHAWPVVLFVFFLALSVLMAGGEQKLPVSQHNKLPLRIPRNPPNATRIQLPDGRYVAYQEQGVPQDQARYSLITAHSFLSSRLSGLPGISLSLLEEFGVRLVTYDLPGFGESDPHPYRNLNTSAHDLLNIADAVGFKDKFWIVGYSGGGIHAWAALRYIPERLAGAALFAPMGNPYDPKMTKEERHKTWDKWTLRRKLLLFLARRLLPLLPYFYQRSFLSGGPIQPAKWLSLSLGKKCYRTDLWLKIQYFPSFGQGMWMSPPGKAMLHHLSRKLFCKFQTGALASLTCRCRGKEKIKGSSLGSNLCTPLLNGSGQGSLAPFTYGRGWMIEWFRQQ